MVRKFISIFREKWDPGYGRTLKLAMPISGFGIPTGHPVTLGMKYRGARRDQHAVIPRKFIEMGGLAELHKLTHPQDRIVDTRSEIMALSTRIILAIPGIEATDRQDDHGSPHQVALLFWGRKRGPRHI